VPYSHLQIRKDSTLTPFVYRVFFAEVGALLILAAFPLPYSFYTFLRGVVSIGGGFLVYRAFSTKNKLWAAPGIASLLLFPSIFGFEFDKETWVLIDLALGISFLFASYFLGRPLLVSNTANDGKKELEKDDLVKSRVAIAVTLSVAFFFLMFGRGADTSGCVNWINDGRGGYCEEFE
jgi:hypothetical protein